MFTVYVLRSLSSSKLYIGQSADIARRLAEHDAGLARYTSSRGPWQLIFREDYNTRSEAMRREKFLKSGQGRDMLNGMLNYRAGPPEAD